MSATEQIAVKQYDEETPWPEPRTFVERPPYLTRVTVAGNRLSDLIDTLKQMDPDLHVVTGEVCRDGTAVIAHPSSRGAHPYRL